MAVAALPGWSIPSLARGTTMLREISFLLRCLRLNRVARLAPERLKRLQTGRLQHLVAHAVTHSPFFRKKYRGIDIDRLNLTDLPTVTKRELMENFDETLTHPGVRRADLERFINDEANRTRCYHDRYVISHTSGSQGQPLLLVQEKSVYELLFALQLSRGNAAPRLTIRQAMHHLRHPVRLATVGSAPGFYPSSMSFAHLPPVVRSYVRLESFSATDPQLLDRLNRYQPHILIAYASVLDILAVRSSGLRLAPTLRQIVNNSETLSAAARRRLNEAFGVTVLDNYASGECVYLTNGCPNGPGSHVNADWAILEVVDENNRPVPAGTLGRKVLLTSLASAVQPIIRYEVGDMLALGDKPCPCGSRLPKIVEIQGRTGDSLWVRRNGDYLAVPALMFKNVLDYMHEVREWQAVQEARNQIKLRLELLPGAPADEPALSQRVRNRFRAFGMPEEVVLSISIVPILEVDPATHKTRRIIDRVGLPAEYRPMGGAAAEKGPFAA
jgi:phenylacetate-coenzyme A ligase PaaK-like adenylate-forming protein